MGKEMIESGNGNYIILISLKWLTKKTQKESTDNNYYCHVYSFINIMYNCLYIVHAHSINQNSPFVENFLHNNNYVVCSWYR